MQHDSDVDIGSKPALLFLSETATLLQASKNLPRVTIRISALRLRGNDWSRHLRSNKSTLGNLELKPHI